MKKTIFFLVIVTAFLFAGIAAADDLYVDDDGVCGGNTPCDLHPQDAVNAAIAGDTISVYPGTYGSRNYPNGNCNDTDAPALIVYKENLTIQATGNSPK